MSKLNTLLPAALALTLATTLPAQLTPLQDPANLAGERVSPQDPADTLPLNHGAPALQQLLAKLRTRASLMLIVAHPDDEDGGLLTYESRGQGARVAMLTLTRGEGGQNLMSADFDDALGLIRTQELLAADRYFGVDQFFGTEVDFGFSKTKEESFTKWTHERVLYDAVRAVRLYRPLVIASVFVGGPTDGHGHHQVAGEIAQEVFLAAADPKVFPEMIAQGLLPWAPLKVYARVPFSRVTPEGMYDYATGKTVPTRFHNYVTGVDSTAVPSATVLIHEGNTPTDPTLAAAMGGDTYVQFARKGLALQKTQIGPNVRLAPPGRSDTGYTLIASRVECMATKAGCPTFATASSSLMWASTKAPQAEQSLFDGIDTTLPGLASLASDAPDTLRINLDSIYKQVIEAQRLFDPVHLERSAPPLREALRTLDTLLATSEASVLEPTGKQSLLHELRIKRVQLNNALADALGLTFSVAVKTSGANSFKPLSVSIGTHLSTEYQVAHQGEATVSLTGFGGDRPSGAHTAKLARTWSMPTQINVAGEASSKFWTRPYFTRPNTQQPFYDLLDPALRNAPAKSSFLQQNAFFRYQDASVLIKTSTSPLLALSPLVSVSISPSTGMIASTQKSIALTVHAENGSAAEVKGLIHLELPQGWTSVPHEFPFTFETLGNKKDFIFTVTPQASVFGNRYTLTAVTEVDGTTYTESFRPVGYPGLPYTNFYTPATYRATAVDVTTAPNLRIAYLPGTGDTVSDFLPNLGITPTLLTPADLTPAKLRQYDAVLLGVRAYAAHPELAGTGSQPLLDYAKAGGVVIAQYNTARYGDAEAPFPIEVPGDPAHNVVEEAQPVTLLQPNAPLLTWPNQITPADFDHWVAERGHGFAASWSPDYTPLLETHDVGQDPQRGGLLLARTGKGAYIYCALALYRQLPEGVPGAYRLLANLLSYGKNPASGH